MAGNEFTPTAQQTLWVVILLTDGQANAGFVAPYRPITARPTTSSTHDAIAILQRPGYIRADPTTDANRPYAPQTPARFMTPRLRYDMADYVGKNTDRQDALIYTIGLGGEVQKYQQPGYADPTASAGQTNEVLVRSSSITQRRPAEASFLCRTGQTWTDLYADRHQYRYSFVAVGEMDMGTLISGFRKRKTLLARAGSSQGWSVCAGGTDPVMAAIRNHRFLVAVFGWLLIQNVHGRHSVWSDRSINKAYCPNTDHTSWYYLQHPSDFNTA